MGLFFLSTLVVDCVIFFGEFSMLLKNNKRLLLCMIFVSGIGLAKPLPSKYGKMQGGHIAPSALKEIKKDAQEVIHNYSPDQYQRLVEDPYHNAKTDQEKIAAIAAREIIFLVDRSGSMGGRDEDPTGRKRTPWTLWRSAEEAAISLFEVATALDTDGTLDIVLWDQVQYGTVPRIVHENITQLYQIQDLFQMNKPEGITPLGSALEWVYENKLAELLNKNEPFTVVILTDGMPTPTSQNSSIEEHPKDKVYQFFNRLVQNHRLTDPGRESLAAFVFIQAGDDIDAKNFLTKLDDELKNGYFDSKGRSHPGLGVDIIDYKMDNFIFGTGSRTEMTDSSGRVSEGGPMAIFWGAMYD